MSPETHLVKVREEVVRDVQKGGVAVLVEGVTADVGQLVVAEVQHGEVVAVLEGAGFDPRQLVVGHVHHRLVQVSERLLLYQGYVVLRQVYQLQGYHIPLFRLQFFKENYNDYKTF